MANTEKMTSMDIIKLRCFSVACIIVLLTVTLIGKLGATILISTEYEILLLALFWSHTLTHLHDLSIFVPFLFIMQYLPFVCLFLLSPLFLDRLANSAIGSPRGDNIADMIIVLKLSHRP
jgi:hypothetical protein